MSLLLTIAARGGSKGVKNKNIREIGGVPLIAITIRQALTWGEADKVIVTTDSPEIAEVAKNAGAEVPFLRPKELATDEIGKLPALRHALLEAEKYYGKIFDTILDLDPTAPIRKVQDLENSLKLFRSKKCKSLFSVAPAHKSPYFNMVELDEKGFAKLSKDAGLVVRRQDVPKVYSMNASIYVYGRDYLADPLVKSAISNESLIYEMDELSGVDIDREIDFKFVEYLVTSGTWKIHE
jgi:CMP-N,N'-diacetyllegionaminic acid synthase